MAWVDLNTKASSATGTTQNVAGRSGSFQVNYAPEAGGGTPVWVWLAAGLALVYLMTKHKT